MMKTRGIVGGLVLVLAAWGLVATGCSSSDSSSGSSASQVTSLCQRLVYCGQKDSTTGQPLTQAACESNLKGWIMPSGCLPAMQNATCADVTAATTPAAIQQACFPACAATTCSSDNSTISICNTSGAMTFACTDVCARKSMTYIGICGTSANGQTSATPVCWCK